MDIDKICDAILHAPLRSSNHDMSHYTLIKTVLEQTAEHVRREYDAATRSAAGPAAQGWRLLEQGEILQDGDEWLKEEEWFPNKYPGDKLLVNAIVRRRMPAAPAMSVTQALIDAGIELHNASDDNSKYISGLCKNWRKALADYEKLSPTNAPQVISRVNFDTRETELIVTAPAVGDVGALVEAAQQLAELVRHYLRFSDENLYCANVKKQADWEALHSETVDVLAAVTALGKGGE